MLLVIICIHLYSVVVMMAHKNSFPDFSIIISFFLESTLFHHYYRSIFCPLLCAHRLFRSFGATKGAKRRQNSGQLDQILFGLVDIKFNVLFKGFNLMRINFQNTFHSNDTLITTEPCYLPQRHVKPFQLFE